MPMLVFWAFELSMFGSAFTVNRHIECIFFCLLSFGLMPGLVSGQEGSGLGINNENVYASKTDEELSGFFLPNIPVPVMGFQQIKKQDKKILVIDLDPQGNATTGLGLSNTEQSDQTIYGVLNGTMAVSSVIKKTNFQNLDLITSNVDLSGLEVETAGDNDRAFILKAKLTAYLNDSKASYDYILIDCPPSLSLLTVMALVSSNSLLVPLQTEFFALEGITQLVKTIDRIKENLNPALSIRGILLTMFDKRNKLSSEVDREARNYFKDKVYQTVIQRNVRLSEAPSHGMPCVIYDKNCVGSKSYFKLAEEFSKKNNIESAA